jgi:hypothetical protein
VAANAVGIGLAYPFHRITCRKIDWHLTYSDLW